MVGLSPTAVVGPLDPPHDRDPQFCTGVPDGNNAAMESGRPVCVGVPTPARPAKLCDRKLGVRTRMCVRIKVYPMWRFAVNLNDQLEADQLPAPTGHNNDAGHAAHLAERSSDSDLVAMRQAFGSWKDHDLDDAEWAAHFGEPERARDARTGLWPARPPGCEGCSPKSWSGR